MKTIVSILTTVVLVLTFGSLVSCAKRSAIEPVAAQEAAPFVLESLGGEIVKSEDYFGKKVVFLNFWTTECSICEEETPHLKKLYAEYKDMIALFAIDVGESKKKVAWIAQKRSINYPVLLDTDGQVAVSYGLHGVPTIVIIGMDKKVVYYGHDLSEAKGLLVRLLGPEKK